MAAVTFNLSLKAVLVFEGGYVNHPKDPGGETNRGVTKRVYDGYRKSLGKATQSVKLISEAEVADIYRRQYWNVVKGDRLPTGVDFAVFDGAVNSGPSQAVKWLQRALQALGLYGGKIDGVCGEATVAAANRINDNDALVAAICARRLDFCQALKTWQAFGKGWSSRIAQAKKTGQAWATGSVGPDPVWSAEGAARAVVEDAKPIPTKAPGDLATAAGTTTSVGAQAVDHSTTLEQIRASLEPHAASIQWVAQLVAILTVAGALVTIGGLAYRWYATRKAKKLSDALDLPSGVAA